MLSYVRLRYWYQWYTLEAFAKVCSLAEISSRRNCAPVCFIKWICLTAISLRVDTAKMWIVLFIKSKQIEYKTYFLFPAYGLKLSLLPLDRCNLPVFSSQSRFSHVVHSLSIDHEMSSSFVGNVVVVVPLTCMTLSDITVIPQSHSNRNSYNSVLSYTDCFKILTFVSDVK